MTRPTLSVAIAFASDPMDTAPLFEDISAFVLEIPEIRRGRARLRDRMAAGTARVILDNKGGDFTPGNWRSSYAGNLVPMRRIRISATWGLNTYAIFNGFVERWPPNEPGGADGTVEIECVDGFAWLAAIPVTTSRGVENAAARAIALKSTAGWTIGDYLPIGSPDGALTTVAAVTLSNEPILAHLLDLADAEDGLIYMDQANFLSLQGRHYRLLNTRATDVQLLLGDSDDTTTSWVLGTSALGLTTTLRPAGWSAGDDPERPYIRVDMSYDVQDIINESRVTPSGGAEQVASDALSQRRYGTRARVRSLLLTSTTEAADRAAWEVAQNREAQIRFDAVTTSGLRDAELWPELLGLELSDRVEVRVRRIGHAAIARQSHVEQIVHRNLVGAWETTLGLSQAADAGAGVAYSWMVLNTGVLDTGVLVY